MAWARILAVCCVVLACGGRARRDAPIDDSDASGGSSSGSPGDATAGRTGSTGGQAGTNTGAGGSAGSVFPTADTGASDSGGASSSTGGTSGSASGEGGAPEWTDGPPPGEPAGTRECPQGPATDYRGALPAFATGFRGELDGVPVEIEVSELGGVGCHGSTTSALELFFDGDFAGDQLTLYFNADAGCLVQAWYLPSGQSAEPATIQSTLHLWHEQDPSAGFLWSKFVYAELVIESIGVDGNVTHRLEGELTLRLVSAGICVG